MLGLGALGNPVKELYAPEYEVSPSLFSLHPHSEKLPIHKAA